MGVGWGVSVLDNKDLLGNINELGVYYMVSGKKTPLYSPFRNSTVTYVILEEFR